MAWSSTEPRRSGAFIIELVERAPQNKLKEQLGNIKEKILHSSSNNNPDDMIKPGDTFRLRSLKFPEFELGLTSVKIRDDYCYLGLRKVSCIDTWCIEAVLCPNHVHTLYLHIFISLYPHVVLTALIFLPFPL